MWRAWIKWSSWRKWTSTICHSHGPSTRPCIVRLRIWRCVILVWKRLVLRIWIWPSRKTLHGIGTSISSMTWRRIWSLPSKRPWIQRWMKDIIHQRLSICTRSCASAITITRHGKTRFNAVWLRGERHIRINSCSRHRGMYHWIVFHIWRR